MFDTPYLFQLERESLNNQYFDSRMLTFMTSVYLTRDKLFYPTQQELPEMLDTDAD